jgi:hypothetical protein
VYAGQLYLTTVADQFYSLAEEAVRKKQSHLSYLEALLEAEVEERDPWAVIRRIKEAHFPAVKTLEEFDFQSASHIPPQQVSLIHSYSLPILLSPNTCTLSASLLRATPQLTGPPACAGLGFAFDRQACQSHRPNRVQHCFAYGRIVHFQLLSTDLAA